MSPGPGFAITLRNSLHGGILKGVITAFGIALGDFVLILLAVSGASILISQRPDLLKLLQFLGALYLGYLGYKALKIFFKHVMGRYKEECKVEAFNSSGKGCFRAGFIVTVLNPKAIIFFISISSQFLHLTDSYLLRVLYSLVIITITFMWFSFVSLLVGHPKTRGAVSKYQFIIEAIMGVVLILYCTITMVNLYLSA